MLYNPATFTTAKKFYRICILSEEVGHLLVLVNLVPVCLKEKVGPPRSSEKLPAVVHAVNHCCDLALVEVPHLSPCRSRHARFSADFPGDLFHVLEVAARLGSFAGIFARPSFPFGVLFTCFTRCRGTVCQWYSAPHQHEDTRKGTLDSVESFS